jgi:hypothetical protein
LAQENSGHPPAHPGCEIDDICGWFPDLVPPATGAVNSWRETTEAARLARNLRLCVSGPAAAAR